jgi:hypothetical protein
LRLLQSMRLLRALLFGGGGGGGGGPKRPNLFTDFVSNMFCIHAVSSLLVRTSKLIFVLWKEMSYSSPDGHIDSLLHRELCVSPGWDLKS